MKFNFLRISIGCIVLYLCLLLLLWGCQTSIILQPTPLASDFVYRFDRPFTEITLSVAPEVRLNALFFETTQQPKRGVAVFYHGNRDNLSRWGAEYAPRFLDRGYDVFMYDYRTYGKSTGKPSEAALLQDANVVYEWAKQRYAEDKIVVYGYSLGTGMATQVAAHYQPSKLILEAPYVSIAALSRSYFPFLPYEKILKYRFRTDLAIQQVRCPVHLIHGTADRVVPYKHSLRLCKLMGKSPQNALTTIPAGGHKYLGQLPVYVAALDSLLLR